MPKETDKQRIFSRRALIFGGVQVAGVSALMARLYYLQLVKKDEYAMLSENNRVKLQLLAPERGHILDKDGLALALNEKNYRLFLDYATLDQETFRQVVQRVHALIPLNERKLASLMEAKSPSAKPPELLKEHLTWEEMSRIELASYELPAVSIEIGQLRAYPLNEKAAHLIGYVGAVSEEEMEKGNDVMRLPDFRIGKNGVEKMLENRLRGTPGIRQLEVNVHGTPVREIATKQGTHGESINLTIDRPLQEYICNLLEGQSAGVAVMDVHSGDVRALVSVPGFDPNVFSKGIPHDYWNELRADKKNPLLNKTISGQYPPGSTFKMIVGLAALESGLLTSSTAVFCPGHFYLGDHRFNCWKEGGHGTVNYAQAIAGSCDTFFYTQGQKLGIDRISAMAKRFGFGEPTGLGLVGEKGGIAPDAKWKQKRYKQRWTTGDTVNASIGQGYNLATPLQLAVMTARMVNGGYAVQPRLETTEKSIQWPSLALEEEHLQLNLAAMQSVCEPGGTAYAQRIMEERFAMGGKTGTSQVRKIFQRGMNQNLLPWEHRHHAWFVGYAPIDAPQYACAVLVEHGGGGASTAAPLARDILLKTQQLAEAAPAAEN